MLMMIVMCSVFRMMLTRFVKQLNGCLSNWPSSKDHTGQSLVQLDYAFVVVICHLLFYHKRASASGLIEVIGFSS